MRFLSLFIAIQLCCVLSLAQSSPAVVNGQITDKNGTALPGAVVEITETGQTAISDTQGRFQLKVRQGQWILNVSALGFTEATYELEANEPLIFIPTIELEPQPETEMSIRVVGSLAEGQKRALDEQRIAPNIKNIIASDQMGQFPDKNAAEATQRIPGITIARDQGEGRYVQVRGTEARLNQTLLNGMVLPAPEGDLRTVALDVVPIDLLEAIEVTKALTPSMDGDAIGGAVNLVAKKAPRNRQLQVGATFGHNQLSGGDLVSGNLLFGRRFAGEKLGIIASLTSEDSDRGTDNFEASYDDGLPEELEQRDYEVNRKRIGANLSFDFQPNARSTYSLNTSYAQFDDQEFRRRLTHNLEDGELERELKDRFETQLITSAQFTGSIFNSRGGNFKFSLSHSYARETEPNRLDTNFVQEDVEFDPNFSEGNLDSNNIQPNPLNQNIGAYALDKIVLENNKSKDEHDAAKASYSWSSSFGASSLVTWEVGGKFRRKEKDRVNQATEFESSEDVFLSDFIDNGYSEDNFLGGRYQMGPFMGRNQVARLLGEFIDESEIDREAEAANYAIQEDNYAAYAMATIEIGEAWSLLPGFRYERLDNSYTSFEVTFDDEGDYLATTPTQGEKDDNIFLPMFHATYHFDGRRQLRTALTRSYARARVYDAVPYRLTLEEDREIEEGNPDLELTDAWNLDLMYEHYMGGVGLFSAGVFYKDLQDYIYIFRSDRLFNGEEYEVTQPQNGDEATLWGAELAFQKTFTSLPAPFDGLGLYLNFTLTDSDADLEDRSISLPGQSEEMGNLALQYERGGFSVRVSGNLQGEYILEVGDDASEDVWVDEHLQWDLSASYRYRGMRFYLEALNLTDEKYVVYEGTPQTPIQFERYKTWGRLGFNYSF